MLVSPAVKKRRVRSSQDEGEEGQGDVGESLPPNQLNLFSGFSFLLTQRSKDDKHYGEVPSLSLSLTPPLYILHPTTIVVYMYIYTCHVSKRLRFHPSSQGWPPECPIHTMFVCCALRVSLLGLGFLPLFSSSAITLAPCM